MKEEALKLADELAFHQGELSMWTRNESCRMIRRLVEELDKQEYRTTHEGFSTIIDKVTPQLKPLSDEEIKELSELTSDPDPTDFVRAIEERHGIK